ncbi:unnamed protein product [Gongylonema pulchrum]|uniref:NUP210 Ig-like domain-containing protein n=1 Tax=Gongylonema pulchrum TaxID=637853 RepID=A0A183D4W4_9BILA|nr:unnamed protein product [Gongylonema pulchrum]
MPVAALHLHVKYTNLPEKPLTALPLGYRLNFNVESRDHLGRTFDAAKHLLNFRPHRFDLTEIFPSNDNHSFDILLKEVGETVFKVWDRNNPELEVFLRLPVADAILPRLDSLTVSEIICFNSPLPTVVWKELDAKRHFQFVDAAGGVAVAREAGEAVVASYDLENQAIFTKMKIVPATSLYFSAAPSFISNIKGHRYVLPVTVDNEGHSPSNVHGTGYFFYFLFFPWYWLFFFS